MLSIPSLGERVRLVQGGPDLTTLAFPPELDHAVAHYPTTALPWESAGTMLVAGHRTTWDKPFARLNLLRRGQEIVVTTGRLHGDLPAPGLLRPPVPPLEVSWRSRYVYRVFEMRIVRPTDFSFLPWTTGREIALAACHPPHRATFRLVVVGSLARISSL